MHGILESIVKLTFAYEVIFLLGFMLHQMLAVHYHRGLRVLFLSRVICQGIRSGQTPHLGTFGLFSAMPFLEECVYTKIKSIYQE